MPLTGRAGNEKLEVPPALVSFLAPLALGDTTASQSVTNTSAANPSSSSVTASSLASASLTAALRQRVVVLQAENDELGELLSAKRISRLYEENRGIKKALGTLEDALRGERLAAKGTLPHSWRLTALILDSHSIIANLTLVNHVHGMWRRTHASCICPGTTSTKHMK